MILDIHLGNTNGRKNDAPHHIGRTLRTSIVCRNAANRLYPTRVLCIHMNMSARKNKGNLIPTHHSRWEVEPAS